MMTISNPNLTVREQQILSLTAHEFTCKEIANQLFIAPSTVKTHRKKLQHKLRVKNAAGLVRKSFELGILRVSI